MLVGASAAVASGRCIVVMVVKRVISKRGIDRPPRGLCRVEFQSFYYLNYGLVSASDLVY